MKPHASLTAPYVKLENLRPQARMDAYVPCWCGSGKKWKFCHKDREKQRPREIGETMAKMHVELQQGYCSHPDAGSSCSAKIIRSHTVQRAVGLGAIAENGHVLSGKAGLTKIYEREGTLDPESVGVKSASTFNGFCGLHDSAMFRPVETGQPSLSTENVFLLAFRALAYELYVKQAALRSIDIQREIDFGLPFEHQALVQTHLHAFEQGLQKGVSALLDWKRKYDDAYLRSDWKQFAFYAVQFDQVLPVVAAGAFQPEVDFHGQQLQWLAGDAELDHIVFNLTVLNGNTVAMFAWLGGRDGPAAQLVNSFVRIPDNEKSAAVIHLAFEHIENTFIKPSWWAGLPEDARNVTLRLIRSGIGDPDADRHSESLAHRPVKFSNAKVLSVSADSQFAI